MDTSKPSNISLPPISTISSLIDRPNETPPEKAPERSPTETHARHASGDSQSYAQRERLPLTSPKSHQPPTPPLPPTSSFDFSRPNAAQTFPSTSSAPNAGYYSQPSPVSNSEAYASHNSSYPPIPDANQWPASNPAQPSPTGSSGPEGANRVPLSSYPDPEGSSYSTLAQQRPLPSNFPPPIPNPALPPIDPQMAPAWHPQQPQQQPQQQHQHQHHHHYFPPSTTYTQSQERYVCPTCSKPFSRPSSLKIHTYSHTGEKPFKCKHAGCGKTFSVRSNMKRHEKGCHEHEAAATQPDVRASKRLRTSVHPDIPDDLANGLPEPSKAPP